MALIDYEKKYIYFHFFKCGGNAIRLALKPKAEHSEELLGGHCLPRDLKKTLYEENKKETYDSYFKFALIRNPFDWLLSTYYYIRIFKNHKNYPDVINQTLAQFIEYYCNYMMVHQGLSIDIGKNKCVTPLEYITDDSGEVIVDYVGRYENLNDEYKKICEKIGIEYTEPPVYNVNITKEKDYRKYYDNESRDLVEKYFEKDLKYFDYKF